MGEWKKYLPLITRLLRAVMLYPCFLLIWVLSMLTMGAFVIDEAFIRIAAAIWMPFVFFSAARVFAENDEEGNARLGATGVGGFWPRIRVLICAPVFWIDAGFVLGFFLALPAGAGFYHTHLLLFGGLAPGAVKIIFCVFSAPLIMTLVLFLRAFVWKTQARFLGIDAGVWMIVLLLSTLAVALSFWDVSAFLAGASKGLRKLLVCVIGVPLLFLLVLFARLSAWQKYEDEAPVFAQAQGCEKSGPDMVMDTIARGQWAAHSMGMGTVVVNDSVETLSAEGRAWLRREEHKKHFLLQIFGVLLLYLIGGLCVYFMAGTLVSAWRILLVLGSLRWWLPLFLAFTLIGGFWMFFLLRAIVIRRRFLKNLRKLCAEYGFAVEHKKRCITSLLKYRSGVNFTLHANGKTYDCKFFGALRRHWDMYFHENGTLKTRRAIRFRRVEMFCYTSEYDFSFESEHVKICIVAPVPNTISAGNEHWHRPIDTGTKVGDYRIFSSTGFLNALRRDCVERDK